MRVRKLLNRRRTSGVSPQSIVVELRETGEKNCSLLYRQSLQWRTDFGSRNTKKGNIAPQAQHHIVSWPQRTITPKKSKNFNSCNIEVYSWLHKQCFRW